MGGSEPNSGLIGPPKERPRNRIDAGKLPRRLLQVSKRDRLLNAFVVHVAEEGFPGTHVENVCREVSVSTREFYRWFGDKDRCYLALFGTLTHQVIERSQREFRAADGPWEVRMRAALEAATTQLAAHPRIVRFLHEWPRVRSGRHALLQVTTSALQEYLPDDSSLHDPEVPSAALEAVVGGVVVQPIQRYVREGKTRELPELVPWILYYMTLDLFGQQRAAPYRPAST